MKKSLLIASSLFILGLMSINNAEAYCLSNPNVKLKKPIFRRISPSIISPGDEITITGNRFGYTGSAVEFSFRNLPATIISWSDTKVVIKAPASFFSSEGYIKAQGDFSTLAECTGLGCECAAAGYFVGNAGYYWAKPQIESISPADNQPYVEAVKIAGNYFGDSQKELFFGDTKASIVSWENTVIYAVVPNNAKQPITVKVSDDIVDTIEYHYLNPAPEEVPAETDDVSNNNDESINNDLSINNDELVSNIESNDDVVIKEKALAVIKDKNLTRKLKGKILLQVEEHGEAWYINPNEEKKFYLKDGETAYQMLREFGLGITNADLEKIPVAGSNQAGDYNLVNRLKGHILLQVQEHGEAWYINPDDGKRYYLKDGDEAYRIMRELSLGITNNDLRKIEVGEL